MTKAEIRKEVEAHAQRFGLIVFDENFERTVFTVQRGYDVCLLIHHKDTQWIVRVGRGRGFATTTHPVLESALRLALLDHQHHCEKVAAEVREILRSMP